MRPKILVVDDDVMTVTLVVAALGYETNARVYAAHDGERALELVEAHRPDVVLTDFAMPGLDGVELTRRIREDSSNSHTSVILMSASGDVDSSECDAFLPKPFDLVTLTEQVLSRLPDQQS